MSNSDNAAGISNAWYSDNTLYTALCTRQRLLPTLPSVATICISTTAAFSPACPFVSKRHAPFDYRPTRAFADTTQVLVLPDMARDSRMVYGGGRNSVTVIGQTPRTSTVSAACMNVTRLNQATLLQRLLPVHVLQCNVHVI